MLVQLTVRDFIIVDHLELVFQRGFGALTGETGAGKSILIDALMLALGERADTGMVRPACEKADVVAMFDISRLPEVQNWLRENDLESDDLLLLRRVLDNGGRSRAYVNGAPATLNQLKALGEQLLDVHGQHAHQSLLRADAQRQLLDAHGGLLPASQEVSEAWKYWQTRRLALETAQSGSEALAREREQLSWQVQELETLHLMPGEWTSLQAEHQRLAHAASLIEGAEFALAHLSEGEQTALQSLDEAQGRIENLADVDPALREVADLLASARVEVGEAVSQLRRYGDRVELDPERLTALEHRLDAVHSCARKYRVSPEELPDLLAGCQQRLAELTETVDMERLAAQLAEAEADYRQKAEHLSAQRVEAAGFLGAAVTELMGELAMERGLFQVGLLPLPAGGAYGLEQIEFRVGGLSGGEPRPLAKVASGGELSRISLALQVVTSRSASVPTLIFDEVDVGIGGGVAEIVGRMLHQLGQERQVMCVTHLPQVAACANWQWQVSKSVNAEGQVLSRIEPLEGNDRVEEIARMLGGVAITETTRQHAREMLGT